MRRLAVMLAAVAGLAVLAPPAASGATFRGTAVDDPEMTVTLRVNRAGVVSFDYAQVPVECSNGDRVREPGAEHSAMLKETGRFSDRIEQPLGDGIEGRSLVRGRIGLRRAAGVVSYDLAYPGGECHSGEIRWRARRHLVETG